ncbi:MBL fold metallo-hydrolase RNA specificity domain-containing protein [Fusibacter tunisiensis]|uniref:Metallo-beta-lactamase family protein n=1 Tax=Fusibacter tunisiensis TaxID=1008308 RepID=A0ABS2MR86_9FIRM|nr:MBL fold metallo-hydrolase [Fusibacter tunisiensis]MBM7561886.1 metallo-beta-lactamase family protein [Fusibacter tunisiensis]
MQIQFLGAAGHVTGSMYLINTGTTKFLVDAGLFQGTADETKLNSETPDIDFSDLDALILTHAHIDHSGRIPWIVKQGFHGKVYCTHPTKSLCEILLRDSGKIQEAENEWENKKRKRAGLEPIDPLYTEDDAIIALQYFYPVNYSAQVQLSKDVGFEFGNAGHLLGSAFIKLYVKDENTIKTIAFSGDLGNGTSFLEENPDVIESADYLIMESTYGNRTHKNIELRGDRLIDVILSAYKSGGTTLIPSFAVGRTQEILFEIKHYIHTHDNEASERLKKIPIYLDSPLALDATEIYKSYSDKMSDLIQEYGTSPFSLETLTLVNSVEDSIKLNFNQSPKIIISASGMCEAGRIKHHLKHNLWKPNTHVAIVGYQAEDTLGRALLNGATEVVIYDQTIAVKANVHKIDGFSGHADATQLFNWVSHIKNLKKVCVVHGEPESSMIFAKKIETTLGIETHVAKLYETLDL